MQILVAPSILSADFANLASELKRAEVAGADWIHVDVMDGHFVPNLTIGSPVVASLRQHTKLPLDVHLMISNPDQFLKAFAEAGSTHLTVHVEACTHLQRILSQIRLLGMKAGVALNPATPLDMLTYVLDDLDLVLIMSVNPGFGGQEFLQSTVTKVRALRQMLNNAGRHQVHIIVDGGINASTASKVIEAGANVMVAGKYVYGSADMSLSIASLRGNSSTRPRHHNPSVTGNHHT
ncbi:MAG: ribulose-phosphate 3-epimerase [Candidatus Melainabacteria bacterium]|nr:ribulose-phosphate 3-epimerase [Candidatus Melainabacteria bacterium]